MIPNVIDIGGLPFTVKYDKNDLLKSANIDGMIRYSCQDISLRDNMSKEYTEQVLCHELTHGILNNIGKDELSNNEEFVSAFGNCLYKVLKENKLYFGGNE